jgi:hypothetical protein
MSTGAERGMVGIGRIIEIKIQIPGTITRQNIGFAIIVPIDDRRGKLLKAHPHDYFFTMIFIIHRTAA